MDPTYPLFPIVSFICFILVFSPLPWHIQAGNTGTCMYMIWVGTCCLILFTNSVVWRNDAIDRAPVYCDIATRILMGSSAAVPACGLCIQRRLYRISVLSPLRFDKHEKVKNFLVDMGICLGFPMFIMALAYVSQGHRYDIYEEYGCTYAIYDVWPSIPTFTMWPLVIALISSVYCVRTFYSLSIRRSKFNEFLNSADSSGTTKHYIRLMLLSCTEIVFTIPLASWVLYMSITNMGTYISWADTHYAFHVVWTYPSIIWRNDKALRILVEFDKWITIVCAIVFIAFFTFAEDSRRNYGRVCHRVFKHLGCFRSKHLDVAASFDKHATLPPMFPDLKSSTLTSSTSTDITDDACSDKDDDASDANPCVIVLSHAQGDPHEKAGANSTDLCCILTPPAKAHTNTVDMV